MTTTQQAKLLVPLGTPDEVAERAQQETRAPATDPTLGITVTPRQQTRPPNRLVAIGDSLTQGVQSGAVFATDLSYPAILAHELGWEQELRYPRYQGLGGLPLNIELLLRALERSFGSEVDVWDYPDALFSLRSWMDQLEDYWERGPGSAVPPLQRYHHVLAMYGWDLRDILDKTAASCRADLDAPRDDWIHQVVQNHSERAALRVYPDWSDEARRQTLLDAARTLGEEGAQPDEDGIETLIVFVGANNCLGSVTRLRVTWSGDDYRDIAGKRPYTVWRPEHFREEYRLLVREVQRIRAEHVIWCTIPHVTIAPLARGVGRKVRAGSRYFEYYTRPWIADDRFDPARDEYLTAADARAVDAAIDLYNVAIEETVRDGRRQGKDWYLLDTAGILDRLAARRYQEDPAAAPSWWTPYVLPPQLAALDPVPDSHFLVSDASGSRRQQGGLFSLDGIHPTTVGYGIVAHEMVKVMRLAGVEFRTPNGDLRPDPVGVDFDRLIRRDTLVHRPPRLAGEALQTLGWADETVDWVKRCFPF